MRTSEPHKVTYPQRPPPIAFDEDGVAHYVWQHIAGAMRMGCSYYSLEWHTAPGRGPTCVWCVSDYTPWLAWGPGAPQNRKT